MTDLEARIITLIAKERGMAPDEIHWHSRLEEDLGMTGDDASDFLQDFANEFAVDLTPLKFHKHFGPEGFNPFWLFAPPDWLRDHGDYPVTVAHLVAVAKSGRWFCPPTVSPTPRGPLWDRELDG